MSQPDYAKYMNHSGQVWQRIEVLPRLLAEGWRRDLSADGVVSALLTPSGWAFSAPIYEIVAGIYLGDVGLYVPQVQYAEALDVLGIDDLTGDPEASSHDEVSNANSQE